MQQKAVMQATVYRGRQSSIKVMGWQLMFVALVAFAWSFQSWSSMSFALMGGLSYILPSALFALLFFASARTGRSAQGILGSFYLGEVLKLGLMAALLIFIMSRGVQILPLISGLSAAIIGMWFSPGVFNR